MDCSDLLRDRILGDGTESQILATSPTAANAQLMLLRLPREVRDLIWDFITPYRQYWTDAPRRTGHFPLGYDVHDMTPHLHGAWFTDHRLGRVLFTGAPPICTQIHREITEMIRLRRRVYLYCRDGSRAVHFATTILYRMPPAPVENLRWLQIGRIRPPPRRKPKRAMIVIHRPTAEHYYEEQKRLLAFLYRLRLRYLQLIFDMKDIRRERSRLTVKMKWLGPFLDFHKKSSSDIDPVLEIRFTHILVYGRTQPGKPLFRLICNLRKIDGVICTWP